MSKPVDLANVRSVTAPDVTYVSLSEDTPDLKRYLPWAGTNRGPESIVRTFEGVGRVWETKAFQISDVIEQGNTVATFGSFTYRGRESGKETTSPFSILAKVTDGKIHYLQFLEDTFDTHYLRPWSMTPISPSRQRLPDSTA
jgi:ketosteroid isomerase-like protein